MFAEERYARILAVVNRSGKATVHELSDVLNVSPVTVRRDLEKLEESQLLVRTHGGAISVQANVLEAGLEKSFQEKEEAFVAEKERIAAAAAAMVRDEDAVMLTPGTTNMFLAKKLIEKKGVTLVTNAANIATQAGNTEEMDVILLGGKLRKKSYAMVGPLAEQSLRQITVDKLFLGVDGFDLEAGLTTPNLSEASVNRLMISKAKQVIVVADHSKFGRVMFSHIAPLDVVHTVVSDSHLDEQVCRAIRDKGIQLILV
jgi:DeoR/GlpR family transcriptional regulator of sugar metabolism